MISKWEAKVLIGGYKGGISPTSMCAATVGCKAAGGCRCSGRTAFIFAALRCKAITSCRGLVVLGEG
jgi:hypothetical protein